jgi:hypothetical protein
MKLFLVKVSGFLSSVLQTDPRKERNIDIDSSLYDVYFLSKLAGSPGKVSQNSTSGIGTVGVDSSLYAVISYQSWRVLVVGSTKIDPRKGVPK